MFLSTIRIAVPIRIPTINGASIAGDDDCQVGYDQADSEEEDGAVPATAYAGGDENSVNPGRLRFPWDAVERERVRVQMVRCQDQPGLVPALIGMGAVPEQITAKLCYHRASRASRVEGFADLAVPHDLVLAERRLQLPLRHAHAF